MGASYSDPRFGGDLSTNFGIINSNSAVALVKARHNWGEDVQLLRLVGVVQVAGTGTGGAAAAAYRIMAGGTTSIGVITPGTSAAGVRVTADLSTVAAAALSSAGHITIENVTSEATATTVLSVDWKRRFV